MRLVAYLSCKVSLLTIVLRNDKNTNSILDFPIFYSIILTLEIRRGDVLQK